MFYKLIRWFVANTILPILAPVLYICVSDWFTDGLFPFCEVFFRLIKDGFYVFSALTLIFSLLEDYPDFKISGLGSLMGAILMLLVIITLYIFFLIQTKDSQYVSSHVLQFGLIWVVTALAAIYAKYKLINYKIINGL